MKRYTTIPQQVILSAVTKLEDYIKCTYGKAGRGVLIDNGLYQSVVDDGFIALEEFELEDELENTVILFIKEATRNTNKKAGDATTTSVLILCAILKEVFSVFSIDSDYYGISKELLEGLENATKQIYKVSKKITSLKELEEVALNAYNNKTLSKMVAEIIYKIGVDGVVSVDDSETSETTCDITIGMSIDRGFANTQMIPENSKTELQNPAVVILNEDVRDWTKLLPVIKLIGEAGYSSMLLIADSVTDSALAGMLTNGLISVKSPGLGEEKLEVLKDLATILGGKVTELSTFNIGDTGTAKKVKVDIEETNFFQGKGSKLDIENRVKTIKSRMHTATQIEKKKLEERIAKLQGGVAIIKVGALTTTESIASKMKLDDTIHATKLALKEGRILGGGVTLSSIKSGSKILDKALKYPREILEENGKKYIDKDVYDSAGVMIVALQSAVSVAVDLIQSGGIITNKIEKK